jgi:hypothetical protein
MFEKENLRRVDNMSSLRFTLYGWMVYGDPASRNVEDTTEIET